LKKILSLAVLLLLLGVFVSAQEFGSIKGTVIDTQGNFLPGVAVTLTGSKIAPMSTVSSEGKFSVPEPSGRQRLCPEARAPGV
jgi:hypothetical protein